MIEQPVSDKTLSRFRKRCYDYESAYGTDLLHDCITALAEKIAFRNESRISILLKI